MKQITSVISIKLPPKDFYLWQTYCNIKQISFAEFIIPTVNEYLKPQLLHEIIDQSLFISLHKSIENMDFSNNDLKIINFRIKNVILNIWDDFCNKHYTSRTNLIKQSITFFLIDPKENLEQRELTANEVMQMKQIILNMILKIGVLDFSQIAEIFENLDSEILIKILNKLERDGSIGRKGRETYVPANPTYSTIGTLFVSENLGQIIETIKTDTDEVDNIEHKSLILTIFQYFNVVFESLHQGWHNKNTTSAERNLKKLKSAISQIMEITFDD